jgi:hypothetical protein
MSALANSGRAHSFEASAIILYNSKGHVDLLRRTWYRTVRTEHAAVTRLRFKSLTTPLAVIEKLASVAWHSLNRLMSALRADDCGEFDHDAADIILRTYH